MNLLFITSDHQRADSIGLVQAGQVVTPNLNALAAAGTQFTSAYSACPLCVPARAALATGLRPARNGVTWNDWTGAHARECVTLHERLAQAGYALGHAGMDHVRLGTRLRDRAAFSCWVDEEDHQRHLQARGCDLAALEASGPFRRKVDESVNGEVLSNDYSTAHAGPWLFAREDFRDEFFTRGAERAIADLAGGAAPFALFVNYWAPHPPLYVPPEAMNLFPAEQIDLPANVGQAAEGEPANRRAGIAAQLAAGVDEAGWRQAWSAHLALTNLVDQQVGRLLAALARVGVAEETLIIFTSDHGDHLGQHAMYQKMELYDQAARVPLMVRGPGVKAGQKISVPVSHLDLVPTVLAMAEIDALEELDGRSLVAALCGEVVLAPQPVFSQYTGNSGPSVARYAIVHGEHKLILDSEDRSELYDLAHDPLEMNNLAGALECTALEADLTQRINAWMRIPANASAIR